MMDITNSGSIQLLPEHIVDQIKAGEVIERPATLLKELLENSIDANSSKINIHIINNGLDLISVEDNGSGISFDDLPLAFCRHATSKINIFEDLYRLNSYGFRGEALASMSSVSKLTCISNKNDKDEGIILFHGGEMISHRIEKATQPETGTKIFVKDLFYNTPVRIKFLQSQTSERNQLKKIINAFVLTHPEIEFSIKWDDSPKDFFPIVSNDEITERIKKVFDKKKDPLELMTFDNEYDGIRVKGILSHNASKGNAGKFHYLFINDRYVQDTQIHRIILNSAQALWPFGLAGNYIVYVYINPDQLDVNVHPNKTVVKLFQASKVFSLLSSSIKNHLPKSEASHFHSGQENNAFDMADSSINFKDINYRSQDFTEHKNLNNYFQNLDTPPDNYHQPAIGREYFIRDSYIIIYKKESKFYIVNTQKLLIKYINTLLASRNDFTPMPLLVSAPIQINKKLENKLLQRLLTNGIELDYLNEKTLVLRSFAKCLSDLPYDQIITAIIKDYKSTDKFLSINENTFIDFNINDRLFDKIQLTLKVAELITERIIKEMTSQDFLKLI